MKQSKAIEMLSTCTVNYHYISAWDALCEINDAFGTDVILSALGGDISTFDIASCEATLHAMSEVAKDMRNQSKDLTVVAYWKGREVAVRILLASLAKSGPELFEDCDSEETK